MALDLSPFKLLVKERSGLLFEGDGEDKLAAAIQERIAATGPKSPVEYCQRLTADQAELRNLINLLTINETYFFREPEQIRLLVERLVPRLLARPAASGQIRILSAGCSSGEEPYSLAIALHEHYGEGAAHLFALHGGDIDSDVLEKARAGRYSDFSFRGVEARVRDRYFAVDDWNYRIKEPVRSRVAFHEVNLLCADFPDTLRDFDVIFFRNVSIYFDAATRRRIQQNLAAVLKDDGVLVTGTTETFANDLGVLSLVEEEGLFYFVKGRPPLAAPPPPPISAHRQPLAPRRPAPPPPTPAKPVAEEDLLALAREQRYDEALPLLARRLATNARDTVALLLKAHILLNRKDFVGAEAAADAALAIEPWSVDALLLLGLAARWRDQPEAAVRRFKQALYAYHACWPAHYYLAELHRAAGSEELARREYRIALQLLRGDAPDSGVRVVPLGLPPGEVRFLCEHRLAALGDRAAGAR